MFGDIPANHRNQTADNEEEGWRYTQGDKTARRPLELLTCDHVARCIRNQKGRAAARRRFLDIVDQGKAPMPGHIKRKLPELHQFGSWPTSIRRSRWNRPG
jgi:succinate dehydrogenase / fumarate reductase flavoprotein subunit